MHPASGASGLPVGLYSRYISADNNFSSQISAVGVQYTRELASELLVESIDWQPSGVMTRTYGEPAQWHTDAGWIKPAALVNACLAQTGIMRRGHCEVTSLVPHGDGWAVCYRSDQAETTPEAASMVVIAASHQSAALVNTAAATLKLNFQAVRGQVTYGCRDSTSSPSPPVNGGGCYIETDTHWLVGGTYDRDNLSLEAGIRDQVDNLERLENLVPDKATHLKPEFERGLVQNWVGIRCATTDRLPIVGEVLPGLWLCTAMASRGLTYAPLCAEILASQISGEKLPLNARLVKALSVQRYTKIK